MRNARLMPIMAFTAPAVLLALQACGDQAVTDSKASLRDAEQTPPDGEVPKQLQTIDPPPTSGGQSRIAETADITIGGKPACVFTIAYAGATEQPVTWNGEPCSAITASFLSIEDLTKLDKMDRLSAEEKSDIERSANAIFYIESTFTASVYPLNIAGRIYEIPVAD